MRAGGGCQALQTRSVAGERTLLRQQPTHLLVQRCDRLPGAEPRKCAAYRLVKLAKRLAAGQQFRQRIKRVRALAAEIRNSFKCVSCFRHDPPIFPSCAANHSV